MPNLQKTKTPMKELSLEERRGNFDVIKKGYSKEEFLNEADRCLNCKVPSCKEGCPIHNEIPEFISLAKEGNLKEAYSKILENSILPDICGTICPHEKQCEGHCVRAKAGDPVNIGALERYIVENAKNSLSVNGVNKKHIKVATVGTGPASIAFALYLAEHGYDVTMFEKESFFGGILTWGIPNFRLSREAINYYKNRLIELGVEIKYNHEIVTLDEIRKEYKAIFLGNGAPKSNVMHVDGEDLEGVYSSYEFLKKVSVDKDTSFCGNHVVVVGGGNAAMDVARTAIRLRGVEKVSIVYRRTENEMPACKEELEDAKTEGVVFKTLTNPTRFIGQNSKVESVEFETMILGEPDSSGRRRPVPSNEPHFVEKADTVVLALGFSNDPLISEKYGGFADKYGCFEVNEHYKTSIENVYAGGDLVTGASTVVSAMKAGLIAAKHFSKN